jgi:uncharacterized iron-regulated protein
MSYGSIQAIKDVEVKIDNILDLNLTVEQWLDDELECDCFYDSTFHDDGTNCYHDRHQTLCAYAYYDGGKVEFACVDGLGQDTDEQMFNKLKTALATKQIRFVEDVIEFDGVDIW